MPFKYFDTFSFPAGLNDSFQEERVQCTPDTSRHLHWYTLYLESSLLLLVVEKAHFLPGFETNLKKIPRNGEWRGETPLNSDRMECAADNVHCEQRAGEVQDKTP